MPEMIIRIEGTGGAFADVFRRRRLVEMPHDVPIRVETLDWGMQGGGPSIGFIIELPLEHMVVLAQTSLKLFQIAAAATLGKYGDVTGGALMGAFDSGSLRLNLSSLAKCPGCQREIPGSCKYCPQCGAKL